jgi:imidazolonepropionase-like amidohydrolase
VSRFEPIADPRDQPITLVTSDRLIVRAEEPPLTRGWLGLQGDRVIGVGSGAPPAFLGVEALDLGDATLLPGLIDCHVHVGLPGDGSSLESPSSEPDADLVDAAVSHAQDALASGVTTLRDCGGRGLTTLAVRQVLRQSDGPRLVASGFPLTVPGGHCARFGGETEGTDLAARTAELVAAGADFVKVIGSGGGTPGTRPWAPTYSTRELAAAVQVAHAAGRQLAVHSLTGDATLRAAEAGADHVEHASFTADEDGNQRYLPEVATALLRHKTGVTPTLSARFHTVAALQARSSTQPADIAELDRWMRMLEEHVAQAGRLLVAGVELTAGTDAGWRFTPFGALVDELLLLRDAGMSCAQALAAATTTAARLVGLASTIGQLAFGYGADVLAVEGDPLEDLRALRHPTHVWRAGRQLVGVGSERVGGALRPTGASAQLR